MSRFIPFIVVVSACSFAACATRPIGTPHLSPLGEIEDKVEDANGFDAPVPAGERMGAEVALLEFADHALQPVGHLEDRIRRLEPEVIALFNYAPTLRYMTARALEPSVSRVILPYLESDSSLEQTTRVRVVCRHFELHRLWGLRPDALPNASGVDVVRLRFELEVQRPGEAAKRLPEQSIELLLSPGQYDDLQVLAAHVAERIRHALL